MNMIKTASAKIQCFGTNNSKYTQELSLFQEMSLDFYYLRPLSHAKKCEITFF